MKQKSTLVALIAIIAMALSCQRKLSPTEPTTEAIYFTSFENAVELQEWYGLNEKSWRDDVPPNGDAHSVLISGGCNYPHAYYEFGPLERDVVLGLRCWGKNLSNGGFVSLYQVGDVKNAVRIRIEEQRWMHYESSETLSLPDGAKARIELFSGGIVASSMLIDLLEVYVVE